MILASNYMLCIASFSLTSILYGSVYKRSGIINLILRVGYKNNSCIRETQENLIENSVQDSLPYIQIPNGLYKLNLAYPK